MDQDSEPELNIQYREAAQKEPQTGNNTATESDYSENAPLLSPTRTPGKITPSKLEITFGDKTSTVIYGRNNLHVKLKHEKHLSHMEHINHNGVSLKMAPLLTTHHTQSHSTQTIEQSQSSERVT